MCEAAEPFVSKLLPPGTKLLRTEPRKAMVVGAFVRGLSMRDVESLCEQAGLGKLSRSTAARSPGITIRCPRVAESLCQRCGQTTLEAIGAEAALEP